MLRMRDKHCKANYQDVAYLAGVPQSTVFRVLRGGAMVFIATLERIFGVARQLDYYVDRKTTGPCGQCTGARAADESAVDPFFHSMPRSIIRASARDGCGPPVEKMILPPRPVARGVCGENATIDLPHPS